MYIKQTVRFLNFIINTLVINTIHVCIQKFRCNLEKSTDVQEQALITNPGVHHALVKIQQTVHFNKNMLPLLREIWGNPFPKISHDETLFSVVFSKLESWTVSVKSNTYIKQD